MSKLLFIAIGGAIGVILRYALSGVAYKYMGSGFPWGTLCVNLLGAFVIGMLWGLFEKLPSLPISGRLRLSESLARSQRFQLMVWRLSTYSAMVKLNSHWRIF